MTAVEWTTWSRSLWHSILGKRSVADPGLCSWRGIGTNECSMKRGGGRLFVRAIRSWGGKGLSLLAPLDPHDGDDIMMFAVSLTCRNTLRRSNGAVQVRLNAPAIPPARRWRHHFPVCSSLWVKSSGTFMSSPMSRYWKEEKIYVSNMRLSSISTKYGITAAK